MNIVYRIDTASHEDILQHLRQCDNDYTPPLSARVDLYSYAGKLRSNAVSFEAWDTDGNLLVGIINAYLNDHKTQRGFISNVSVLREYRGMGLASTLLRMCLDYAAQSGFQFVELEVAPTNTLAQKLYNGAGFEIIASENGFLRMRFMVSVQTNKG